MAIRRIGLTGGIGSGKSTVAAHWVALGADLIDTDALARGMTAPDGAAIAPLRDEFGPEVLDARGALDRDRMRAWAFTDATTKRRLESILHPLIAAEALRLAAESSGPAIVFDVPLLGEDSAWRARCDRIAVVDCSEGTQVERVVLRSRWTPDQVRGVIAQQAARPARRAIADAVIDNDGPRTLQQLRIAAQALWALWVAPERTREPL
ncbi:MAG: dephospho-CoA kinase [Burkholderiaceae bacterium]|nr:dephospho-CoA kinase [Burkholderiaceae bacterium]